MGSWVHAQTILNLNYSTVISRKLCRRSALTDLQLSNKYKWDWLINHFSFSLHRAIVKCTIMPQFYLIRYFRLSVVTVVRAAMSGDLSYLTSWSKDDCYIKPKLKLPSSSNCIYIPFIKILNLDRYIKYEVHELSPLITYPKQNNFNIVTADR